MQTHSATVLYVRTQVGEELYLLGDLIGEYKTVTFSGDVGVELHRATRDNHQVLLKTFRPLPGESPEVMQRAAHQEVALLGALRAPQFRLLLDVFAPAASPGLTIVLQPMALTLTQYLCPPRLPYLPPAWLRALVREVSGALQLLNDEARIVHSDLDGVAVLVDPCLGEGGRQLGVRLGDMTSAVEIGFVPKAAPRSPPPMPDVSRRTAYVCIRNGLLGGREWRRRSRP